MRLIFDDHDVTKFGHTIVTTTDRVAIDTCVGHGVFNLAESVAYSMEFDPFDEPIEPHGAAGNARAFDEL